MTQPHAIDDSSPTAESAAARGGHARRSPLLIVAGAGTGKTATLVHRVAWLIARGVDPGRILLLDLHPPGGRRNAPPRREPAPPSERRSDCLLPAQTAGTRGARVAGPQRFHAGKLWGGTFHAVATRLLRRYGKAIGLPPGFTIHDRGRCRRPDERRPHRTRPGQDRPAVPQEGDLHGHLQPLRQRPREAGTRPAAALSLVPGMGRRAEAAVRRLRRSQGGLRRAGLRRPAALLARRCWTTPTAGPVVRKQFDCVLVDEYQDTNALQAEILYRLSPDGKGVTVVGDDAQSIYSFRAATVRNILDLPQALSGHEGHHAGAELPQHAADPGGHQPRDRAGGRAVRQEPLDAAGAGPAAGAGHLRGRGRAGGVRDSPDPRASRGGRRPAAAGGAVPRLAPQHDAGGGTGGQAYSLPQVRRAEVRGDGPREGPAGLPAAGREPARRGGRGADAAPDAGHRAGQGPAAWRDAGRSRAAISPSGPPGSRRPARRSSGRRWSRCCTALGRRRRRPAGPGQPRPQVLRRRCWRSTTITPRRGSATWSSSNRSPAATAAGGGC